MTTITGKEIVAAGSGEQDFDATIAGLAANGIRGERRSVRGGLVQGPDHRVQIQQRGVAQDGVMQRRAQSPGHQDGIGIFFREAFGRQSGQIRRADGEAGIAARVSEFGAREVRDGGGIDAARKEAA
jgi:hypothetical protein